MSRIVAMEDTAERRQFADLLWFWHHHGAHGLNRPVAFGPWPPGNIPAAWAAPKTRPFPRHNILSAR